jgi:hypothetical protein
MQVKWFFICYEKNRKRVSFITIEQTVKEHFQQILKDNLLSRRFYLLCKFRPDIGSFKCLILI